MKIKEQEFLNDDSNNNDNDIDGQKIHLLGYSSMTISALARYRIEFIDTINNRVQSDITIIDFIFYSFCENLKFTFLVFSDDTCLLTNAPRFIDNDYIIPSLPHIDTGYRLETFTDKLLQTFKFKLIEQL